MVKKRARQRAALAALRHAHPEVRMWHQLLRDYQDTDALLPLLRSRSQVGRLLDHAPS